MTGRHAHNKRRAAIVRAQRQRNEPARKPFCAICLEDIEGQVVRRPLGRDGGMVRVCERCDGDRPSDGETDGAP